MEVTKLNEAGYDQAKYGFSLSFKDRAADAGIHYIEVVKGHKSEHFDKVLKANAPRDGGHNKLLEHIVLWLDIEANLEWWKQFDTYRVAVSKQSESTMHTLDRRDVVATDFDFYSEDFHTQDDAQIFLDYLEMLSRQPPRLKSKLLPQGYLQRREVVLNYKVIRHIAMQRFAHKLPEWRMFLDMVYLQVDHPELLPDLEKLRCSRK